MILASLDLGLDEISHEVLMSVEDKIQAASACQEKMYDVFWLSGEKSVGKGFGYGADHSIASKSSITQIDLRKASNK